MGQNETNVQMMCNIFTAALVYQEMQRLAPDLESIHIESFNLKPKSLRNLILKMSFEDFGANNLPLAKQMSSNCIFDKIFVSNDV